MERLLTLLVVLLIPIISLPSKAHTALDKKKLKDFYSWISCKEEKYFKYAKMLDCDFPKDLGDHLDAITVYCENKVLMATWEKDWSKKYGKVKFNELPPEAYKEVPSYTVFYYSYHYGNEPKIIYNDSNSPWAKECKRIFNKPKKNNQSFESIKNKEIKKNDDAHQKCLKAEDYKGCMNYQNR